MDSQSSREFEQAWSLSEGERAAIAEFRRCFALPPGGLLVVPVTGKKVAPNIDLFTIECFAAGHVVGGFEDCAAYKLGDLIIFADRAGTRLLRSVNHAAELRLIHMDDIMAVHRDTEAAQAAEGEVWLA